MALLGLFACLPLLTLGDGIDPAGAGTFAFIFMVSGAFLLTCGPPLGDKSQYSLHPLSQLIPNF
ncbi:hypothetical protein SBV1_2350004 [Verrucomicrobia bacterium]|nr:hypothetical protein SBV1_2350004 [Verrucomicrobiota bacterium]